MRPWIGIDPGAVRTGVALRNGADCLAWRTVERGNPETEIGPGPIFWAEIARAITALIDDAARDGLPVPGIAIEGVRKPSAFMGETGNKRFARPIDLMALSMTFAAIYNTYPDAVIIPPKDNGRGALVSYPENLVTRQERAAGLNRPAGDGSLVSHSRSAYDVAGKAARVRRIA